LNSKEENVLKQKKAWDQYDGYQLHLKASYQRKIFWSTNSNWNCFSSENSKIQKQWIFQKRKETYQPNEKRGLQNSKKDAILKEVPKVQLWAQENW